MGDYAVLSLSPETMKVIDRSRGQLSRSEFLNCVVSSWCLEQRAAQRYITQSEIGEFEEGIKELLRSFLEFVVSYGLDIEKTPANGMSQLLDRLHLNGDTAHPKNGRNGATTAQEMESLSAPLGRSNGSGRAAAN